MRTKTGAFVGRYQRINALRLAPKKKWFLVANRAEAVIYKESPKKFLFVNKFLNPNGKLTETQLDSDKPGRGFSSGGGQTIHHSLDRRFAHHEQAAKQFADVIATALKKAKQNELFTELVLVAEPHFLGLLRRAIPDSVKTSIKEEINREFSQGSADDFRSWLKQ